MRDSYTRYPRTIFWLIQGGEALIGGAELESQPTFPAQVGSFYLGKFPITNQQFEAFDRKYRRSPVSPGDADPAVGISHPQAMDYCRWYGEVSRKAIRLPTEIEWEYACRAGSVGRFFFGDDPAAADRYLWDGSNSEGRLHPLDAKEANGLGLFGMLGGVWEWTSSPCAAYPPHPSAVAAGDPGPWILRGGSFRTPRAEVSCSVRRCRPPDFREDEVGFRIARSFP